jgi:hypothetical protein
MMVDMVDFTMGVLTNSYRFWFGTVRRMRDGGRGMCFQRSMWQSDRKTRGYVKIDIYDPLIQLVRGLLGKKSSDPITSSLFFFFKLFFLLSNSLKKVIEEYYLGESGSVIVG